MNIYSQQMVSFNGQLRAKNNLKDTPANPEGTETTTTPVAEGEGKPANALELQGRYNMAFKGNLNNEPANGAEQPLPQDGQATAGEPKAQYSNNVSFGNKRNVATKLVEGPRKGARKAYDWLENRLPMSPKDLGKAVTITTAALALSGTLTSCQKDWPNGAEQEKDVTIPITITIPINITISVVMNMTINNDVDINITQESNADDIIAALQAMYGAEQFQKIVDELQKLGYTLEDIKDELNGSAAFRQYVISLLQKWDAASEADRANMQQAINNIVAHFTKVEGLLNALVQKCPNNNAILELLQEGVTYLANLSSTDFDYYLSSLLALVQSGNSKLDDIENAINSLKVIVQRGFSNVNKKIQQSREDIVKVLDGGFSSITERQDIIINKLDVQNQQMDSLIAGVNNLNLTGEQINLTLNELVISNPEAVETLKAIYACVAGHLPSMDMTTAEILEEVRAIKEVNILIKNLIEQNPGGITTINNNEFNFNVLVIEYQQGQKSAEDIKQEIEDWLEEQGFNVDDYLAKADMPQNMPRNLLNPAGMQRYYAMNTSARTLKDQMNANKKADIAKRDAKAFNNNIEKLLANNTSGEKINHYINAFGKYKNDPKMMKFINEEMQKDIENNATKKEDIRFYDVSIA